MNNIYSLEPFLFEDNNESSKMLIIKRVINFFLRTLLTIFLKREKLIKGIAHKELDCDVATVIHRVKKIGHQIHPHFSFVMLSEGSGNNNILENNGQVFICLSRNTRTY